MSYAIVRSKNARRHEVDLGNTLLRAQIYSSDDTVEIFVEADSGTLAEEQRRFAILSIPSHRLSEAIAEQRGVLQGEAAYDSGVA